MTVRLFTKPLQDIRRYELGQGKKWLMNDLHELEKVLDENCSFWRN
jgi:hypothetical protein